MPVCIQLRPKLQFQVHMFSPKHNLRPEGSDKIFESQFYILQYFIFQFYHAHNKWKDCHLLSAPGGADVAGDASVNEL